PKKNKNLTMHSNFRYFPLCDNPTFRRQLEQTGRTTDCKGQPLTVLMLMEMLYPVYRERQALSLEPSSSRRNSDPNIIDLFVTKDLCTDLILMLKDYYRDFF